MIDFNKLPSLESMAPIVALALRQSTPLELPGSIEAASFEPDVTRVLNVIYVKNWRK